MYEPSMLDLAYGQNQVLCIHMNSLMMAQTSIGVRSGPMKTHGPTATRKNHPALWALVQICGLGSDLWTRPNFFWTLFCGVMTRLSMDQVGIDPPKPKSNKKRIGHSNISII